MYSIYRTHCKNRQNAAQVSGKRSKIQSSWHEECLTTSAEFYISRADSVEAGQHTSAGDTSENVGTRSLHHGHEPFGPHDGHTTVDCTAVFDGRPGCHHHATSDCVDWVRHEARNDGNRPAQEKGEEERRFVSEDDGFE